MENNEKMVKLCELLERYTKNVDLMIQWERDLAQLASQEQHALLMSHVQKIQPVYMEFRGLEAERSRLMAAMGFAGRTGRDILETLSDQERALYEPVYQKLCDQCAEMQRAEESCRCILNVRLSEIKMLLAKNGQSVARRTTDIYV